MAFDSIALFEGRFRDHLLADKLHAINVSFLVPSMRRDFGGCAGNIAYGMSVLGGRPIPVATVGQDAVDYLDRLKCRGIDVSRIRVVPDTLTATCHITTDTENNQITAFHPGAMAYSADNDLTDIKEKVCWAIVAPDAKEGMIAHAAKLHAANIPFIFDLGQAMPLFSGAEMGDMLNMASAMTLNDYEAGVVEQRIGKSLEQISCGLQALVVTRGAEGAILYQGGRQYPIAPVKVAHAIDPTGCGDAHRAGLLFGLTSGLCWLDSCKIGSLMGALKIAHRGPQGYAPNRCEIAAQLQTAYSLSLPDAAYTASQAL
jgi:adenosine kinase